MDLAGAALPMALACGFLGASGGCNVDFFGPFNSGGSAPFLVAGLVTGFAVGGIVGAINFRSRIHVGKPRLPFSRPLLFGAAWLSIAAYAFVAGVIPASTVSPEVFTPIQLDRTGTLSANFVARHTSQYDVYLDMKRTIPFEDIVDFMRGYWESPPPPPRPGVPTRPTIDWTISGVRTEDQRVYFIHQYYGRDAIGLKMGDFQAEAGRPYKITLKVLKPSAGIQVTDPHVQVQVGVVTRHSRQLRGMLAFVSCLISVGIALGCLIKGAAAWIAFRRSNAPIDQSAG